MLMQSFIVFPTDNILVCNVFVLQFREKIAGAILKNVAGNEKSLKMAKSGYKILGSVTANGDEVSQNARVSSLLNKMIL